MEHGSGETGLGVEGKASIFELCS
eukprot:SAG11_NODE_19764_length_459_cov_0.863889_2_plen_23_part_01